MKKQKEEKQVIDTEKNPELNKDIQEKLNAVEKNFNEDFLNEEPKKTRKRRIGGKAGKAIKEEEERQRQYQELAENFTGVGTFLLNEVVKRLPNPEPVQVEQQQQFENLFNKVVLKYAEILGNYQEESALLLVSFVIIFPRLKKKSNFIEN